jgi:curli biogenesis system outer membrane secretion channel CsgG
MAKRNLLMVMGWAVLFAACASKGPAPVAAAQDTQAVAADTAAGADELDAAIREASDYLNGKVPKGSKAVFLNIKSDYPDLSEYLLSALSENAVNDGVFSVVDRQQLDTIRAELNFQMSGEVSDESAQSIGQMLGAQSIVSGAVGKLGSLYRVQVKAIEVQSAGVQGQWSRNVPNGATIAALTENYATAGTVAARTPAATPARNAPPAAAPAVPAGGYKVGQKGPAGGFVFYDNDPAPVSQAAPTTQTYTVGKNGPAGGLTFYDNVPKIIQAPAPTTQTYTVGKSGPAGGLTFFDNAPKMIQAVAPVNTSVVYKVGDRGPAGGIIFYVNPSSTDGWRYLEAAPASTEGKDIAWSSATTDVGRLSAELGTGKQNTQNIVNHSITAGESYRAAMLCDNLVSGGYDDWFLPSKSELNLMFVYLKEAGIGGFSNGWYWSSSQSSQSYVWAQQFSNGSQNDAGKGAGYSVRAIRQF